MAPFYVGGGSGSAREVVFHEIGIFLSGLDVDLVIPGISAYDNLYFRFLCAYGTAPTYTDSGGFSGVTRYCHGEGEYHDGKSRYFLLDSRSAWNAGVGSIGDVNAGEATVGLLQYGNTDRITVEYTPAENKLHMSILSGSVAGVRTPHFGQLQITGS